MDQNCLLLRVESSGFTGRRFPELGGEAGLGKEGLWQRDHPPGTCALEA